MSNRRLYFCHGYKPEDRPFNEHIWRLLMKAGFYSWIDIGLAGGWSGKPIPMAISFNEWMMSDCDGFAAIVPTRGSQYQRLEYRVAERMGLPRIVFLQEGGTFGAPLAETVAIPTSWSGYWRPDKQDELRDKIQDFSKRVEQHAGANDALGSVGRWRPRRTTDELSIALLSPRAGDKDWDKLQSLLQEEAGFRWPLIPPQNLRSELELISRAGTNDFDLLVLDVGPSGTPRELVGYLHALGMPQIRVCRVSDLAEAKKLGRHLRPRKSGRGRPPFQQSPPHADTPDSLPRFLDAFKLDRGMKPVIFWRTPEELKKGIMAVIRRVDGFRSRLSPKEGGVAVEVSTHEQARRYFAQRYQQTVRGQVFLSLAGGGLAAGVADRLADILRFRDCRCFHYRDRNNNIPGSRLESGEYIKQGLELRINQADVVVAMVDEEYLKSDYCKDELRQAAKLHRRGQLVLRAYAVDPKPKIPKDLQKDLNDIGDHTFRDVEWSDGEVEQKIVADVEESVRALP